MKSLKQYSIPFTGLKLGKHRFDFEVTDVFFNEFEYSLVKKGDLKCVVELDRQETMLVLNFDITGTIDLACDRCLSSYPQYIEIAEQQIAKFSEQDMGDDEDMMLLTKNDNEINVAPLIYEYINVAVPFVAVCTDEGRTQYCDNDMLDKLEKLAGGGEEPDDEQDDPTWDALKKIK
ncbi:DUF177 domain-containing protein [Mucilaginibacter sp. HMF5004]|uniref:YceD family protein n=1 Tax=Mucilaginibacter rivuli TaxID=2857527 RepID=UPI001C5FF7F2|nr:DUF177 domain-containing protein [Mucilaginibacter rivuli]MBW4888655.1 DUF177 domain-containing protein [Mucilaginibacter rivuli]